MPKIGVLVGYPVPAVREWCFGVAGENLGFPTLSRNSVWACSTADISRPTITLNHRALEKVLQPDPTAQHPGIPATCPGNDHAWCGVTQVGALKDQ